MPGTHLRYRDGDAAAKDAEGGDYAEGAGTERPAGASAVWDVYRAGLPVRFDARTLHGVTDNATDTWRVAAWFIFNQENNA